MVAPPTKDEWRRATLVIAKQIALHIAGYRDHEEFARDGGTFAWDIRIPSSTTGSGRYRWAHSRRDRSRAIARSNSKMRCQVVE